MLIDLQLHSNYSDGYLTPTELAKFVVGQGVKVASLTDHNTVRGLGEFKRACLKYKIKPIIGMELYVKLGTRRLNLLWYNFDRKDPGLHKVLRNSQIRRRGQVRKILTKLKRRGFKIDIEKILDKYTHYIPVNHIVDDIWSVPHNRKKIKKLLENKNPREGEIIGGLFRNKDIGKLHESYIDIKRILHLRKKIGGQLILNHPGKHNRLKRDLLISLKKIGLDGFELTSPHHSIGTVMYGQGLASELDLITTGGSDFHRHEGKNFSIQNSWQYYKIDTKHLRKVNRII